MQVSQPHVGREGEEAWWVNRRLARGEPSGEEATEGEELEDNTIKAVKISVTLPSKAKWGEETAAMAKSIVKKWKKLAKTTPTPSKPKAPVMQAKKEVRGGKERAKKKQRDNIKIGNSPPSPPKPMLKPSFVT